MNLLDSLKWRYATKVFDKNKKVSQTDLAEILEAFRLTPSAYGIQPWKLVIVENPELRAKLLPVSWNQSQVIDASHLFILARVDNISDSYIDKYLDKIVQVRGVKKEDLAGYDAMMKNNVTSKSNEEKNVWSAKQVYLALGNLMALLAIKNIDCCPMEGINPDAYDEILGFKELGLHTQVALPIGYRSSEDTYANLPKVRFDLEDLVVRM